MIKQQIMKWFDQVELVLKRLLLMAFVMLILGQLIFVLFPEQQSLLNKSIQYEGVNKEQRTDIVETIKPK